MNRFRNKKKAKEDLSGPRPSIENESSGPFRMFGKKKTQEEEPKADIDFATALPSSDDFRTSLLMNGLSARFSMLREQDDPNSKIGKASDDSVLFPKRQSRLDMFGVGGLQDIAEVESIQAPKFARQGSFNSDDAASTSGSVMNRSKPTEGNNLFGGRQKIYKITGGGNKANGMTGRALYEDDVALSAFQRWRQTEKERSSMEDDQPVKGYEQDLVRSDSPPQNDFSRRRETNSTTSSAPSLARNSTAATSISSNHPMSMTKDSQSNSTSVPGYANNIPERTVTRTRRLYEQGLTQELQDSQSSALSRFDTIAKRPLGVRSPENASSPTSGTFDRRPGVLSKASAPNLRSYTPPATSSPKLSPAETGSKFASTSDQRPSFGSSPPLSPPVSESDEQPTLSIQPNDLGKATAMNVFSRPAQQYDESRYAQRQRQLQQGRETPTSRFRKGSNASVPTSRSRSSSLKHRESSEKLEHGLVQSHSATQADPPRTTFLDDSDTEPSPALPADTVAPRVTLERPNDDDHPALRQSALPTPLSVASNDLSPLTGRLPASQSTSRNISPEDSPTLGPQTGLSGMVRAHLRSTSNASSVYGLEEQDPEPHYSGFPSASFGLDQMPQSGNPWDYSDAERRGDDNSHANAVALPPQTEPPTQAPPPIPQTTTRLDVTPLQNTEDSPENDEFARHLADGARRVRERLTSYADSDTGSNMSTHLAEHMLDLQPPQRPDTRGSLKSKSSFGSMRNKEPRERSQSRARKMLGIGASTMTSAPSPTRSTGDMDQGTPEPAAAMPKESVDEPRSSSDKDEKDENVHAGLKAFRQARRELQRMKELETRNRRPKQSAPSASTPAAEPAEYEHTPAYRAPSQERNQPPVSYNTRKQSEEYRGAGSRAASRASSERDRSGSEASNGRTHSRPPHLRNGPAASDDRFRPESPGTTRHGAMSRSPAFSPHAASNGLSLQTRGLDTPERSPGLPASPRPGGTTPIGGSFPRRPTVQGTASDSLIDTMGSQAIENDPYLATRPRNGSQLNNSSTPNLHSGMAPPLPPINPRRKNNPGGAFRRSDQEDAMAGSPRLPLSPGKGINGRMPSNGYDDAGFPGRKVSMEHSQSSRGRVLQTSPPRSTRNMAQPGTFSSEGGMF